MTDALTPTMQNTNREMTVTLNGKALRVSLTPAAQRALAGREAPLQAEMELYFSCLIRKQVIFTDAAPGNGAVQVCDNLSVRFHPVMSQGCSIDDNPDGPPLSDFPIVKEERFSPQWLEIDYREGQWVGQFGY